MIKLLRIGTVVLLVLFAIGITFAVIYLFDLQALGLNSLGQDSKSYAEFKSVVYKTSTIVGISFLFGLLSITTALLSARNDAAHVIYVEQEKKEVDDNKNESADILAQQIEEEKEAERKIIIANLEKKLTEIIATEQSNFSEAFLAALAQPLELVQALGYQVINQTAKYEGGYAFVNTHKINLTFNIGEGLVGQVIKTKNTLLVDKTPPEYFNIVSGLGKGTPSVVIIIPALDSENEVYHIFEMAFFKMPDHQTIEMLSRILTKNTNVTV